ncbi:hypothetical protein JCM24511_00522 [Saitozyma sp. JCM 24511]|nr:hypothetical protein JCM24511_00522 [Saitozyma sp. JCM 24511]
MDPTTVSTTKRIFQIASSIVFCFTVAGLVFGFAALKPILIDSGVYQELCDEYEGYCKAQDTRLNFLFIVASSVNNVSALPMGSFLDRVGPRTASIFGGAMFGLGCVTFALGIVKPYFDTYLIGYSLMALGAPALFLAQFHLSNAFPARSGLILGAITGAFDASSLPLCFLKVIYFATGGTPSVKTFFLFYTIIPVLLIVQQITFGPPTIYARPSPTLPPSGSAITSLPPTPGDRRISEAGAPQFLSPFRRNSSTFSRVLIPETPLRQRRMSSSFSRISYGIADDAGDEEVKEAMERGTGDGIVGAMFGKSVGQQIGSTWFWVMELMIVVHMTRINWYLTTVSTQLVYYTGDVGLADTLTNAFIFLLPIGGLLSIPAIGYLLDSRPILDVILTMALLGFFFGLLTMFNTTIPQLIGIGMLVIFRPLFYTAISDYAAKVFGFETFGTVYGLAMAMSGAFGLVLTPLDLLTKGPLHGSFTPVNTVLLVMGVVSSATLALRVWSYTRGGKVRLEETEGREAIAEEDEED